jgi:glutamate decarboxylase
MLPEELEAGILLAKKQNRVPFFVNATAGTTVLGAYDDLGKRERESKKRYCHLHKGKQSFTSILASFN